MFIEKEGYKMKNSTGKDSKFNKPETCTDWIRALILITTLLLPAGALAQSTPIDDQAVYLEETGIIEQQDNYQQQSADPSGQDLSNPYQTEKDYSNPYQQPVITEYEQDQMDQAQSALGVPESRRPQFDNFLDARDSAIISQEKLDLLKQDEGF
jgi:hypothetical protein